MGIKEMELKMGIEIENDTMIGHLEPKLVNFVWKYTSCLQFANFSPLPLPIIQLLRRERIPEKIAHIESVHSNGVNFPLSFLVAHFRL